MTGSALTLPRRLASLVKLEHTLFALPFAYVGALLAVGDWPGWEAMGWITVAMVGARTLAMGLNRLIDAEQDALNPRTAARELPSGALSRTQVLVLCVVAFAIFLVAVFQLDPVVRWLWPVPVLLFVVYELFVTDVLYGTTTTIAAAGGVALGFVLLWFAIPLRRLGADR